jgi:GDP-L-fucose synthase
VYTIREIVEMVTDIAGMHGRVNWDRNKPNGREYLGYDLSKIRSIGFATQYPIRTALEETWDWYGVHGDQRQA